MTAKDGNPESSSRPENQPYLRQEQIEQQPRLVGHSISRSEYSTQSHQSQPPSRQPAHQAPASIPSSRIDPLRQSQQQQPRQENQVLPSSLDYDKEGNQTARAKQYTPRNSDSNRSIAKNWFALEATTEDQMSFHIIRTEIKALFWDLFHFAKNRHWKKKLLTVFVVLAFCVVVVDLLFLGYIQAWITEFLIFLSEHPAAGDAAFVVIYVVATLFFVPPTFLLLGAGWAFTEAFGMLRGILVAVFTCFLASVFGALLSFVRARYLMRDLIHLFVQRYPIVKAADQALKRDGLRIMLLLRLCPLIPYNGLNYLGGISALSWETFFVSLIGMLPYQILMVVMGASAGSLRSDEDSDSYSQNTGDASDSPKELEQLGKVILTSVGVATLLIAMALAYRFTVKELRRELQTGDNDMESFIASVRRMSLIDLEDEIKEEGLEITDLADAIPACSDPSDGQAPSFSAYKAMGETT